MNKKQMYVQVVNLNTGKIFSLPTLYTDRTEACVCGQNYVRDRQAEDPCSKLFFRVLFVDSMWWNDDEDEEEETPTCGDYCDGDCQFCPTNYDVESEDSEEPDWEQHREELFQSLLEYCRI